MNHKLSIILGLTAFALITNSCSDDEHEYRSEPPIFKNFTIKSLTTGNSEVHVGERFVVTAEQQKSGRLLNKTTYHWTSTPAEGISHKHETAVIYDIQPQNPTDTLVANKAGHYNIQLTAKYNVSGNTTEWSNQYGTSFTSPFEDGSGKATYTTGGLFYFTVSAEKTIHVLP